MYEGPISIIERTVNDLVAKQEEGVYCMIQEYGISVEKEELLKALAYDRDQYNKGYDDGVREFAERVKGYFDGIIADIESKQFTASLGYEKELYRTCGLMIEELEMYKQAICEISVEMGVEI